VRITALAASAVAVAGTASVSSADVTRLVKLRSHVSINSTGLVFHGKVTSPNPACVAGRKVVLRRTNGDVLGTTTTGPKGHWKITASGSAGITLGHFFARVRRRTEGTAGTIYVCEAARSRTIPYHP
jgi:hypothetical protein